MSAAVMTPQLLIGHSFGGAAVLAAAGAIDSIKAVAVIGAPFEARHVFRHIGAAFEGVASGETAAVSIGGRPFSLSTDFVDDIRTHDQQARIAGLGRALLVLHSPIDEVVSIDNAAGIFQAARHPKSFVSLDDADHLLRRSADAGYAAGVIAAWSSRYLDATPDAAALPVRGVGVEETGAGKFQLRALTPMGSLIVDELKSVGGLGSRPTQYDLVAAALGTCTAMTCRLYAARRCGRWYA